MKTLIISSMTLLLLLGALPALAQDQGDPDTVVLLATRPEVGADDSSFIVETWVWHDVVALNGVQVGYQWEEIGADVTLDSALYNLALIDTLGVFPIHTLLLNGSLVDANANNYIEVVLASFTTLGLNPTAPPSRQRLATHYLSVANWTLSSQIDFDTHTIGAVNQALLNNVGGTTNWKPQTIGATLRDPADADDGMIESLLPTEFALEQNYPNPFNPTTEIKFSIPVQSEVELAVYNVLGQKVRTLVNGEKEAGVHQITWDGASDNGSKVASGVYFYRLSTMDFTETRKMMMLK